MDIFEYKKLNPLDPGDFAMFESDAKDILLSENFAEGEFALDFLNDILEKRGKEIEAQSPQMYDKYQLYWVQLAFLVFPFLETVDQDNILKTRLLFAMQHGYDPDRMVKTYFELYESDEFIKDAFQSLVKDLEQNTEQFGTQPIEIEGRKMMPTLKYWMLDYARFPTKVAKRGSVERLNYINQSVNTRSLTQVYRQQLLKILKFYDDLVHAERPIAQVNHNQSRVPNMDFTPPAIKPVPINIQQKLDDLKSRVSK